MGSGYSTELPSDIQSACHVLKVQDNSPGKHAGLRPFFDFIISINDENLTNDNIKEILSKYANTDVKIKIFSTKTLSIRESTTNLSTNWGGAGILGVSIRYCSIQGANENVWHVLDVKPKSPADFARLKSNTDYIIGSDVLLEDSSSFYQFIEENDGKVVKLYVYNSEDDDCREISITPNSKWSGEGLLGCDIGFGYLHRIPIKPEEVEEAVAASENLNPEDKKVETQTYNVPRIQATTKPRKDEVVAPKLESTVTPTVQVPAGKVEVENEAHRAPPPPSPEAQPMSNIALPGMPPLNVALNSIPPMNGPANGSLSMPPLASAFTPVQGGPLPPQVSIPSYPVPNYSVASTMPPLNSAPYNPNQFYQNNNMMMPPMMNYSTNQDFSNIMPPNPVSSYAQDQQQNQNSYQNHSATYQNYMPMPTFSETPTYMQPPPQMDQGINNNSQMPPFSYQPNVSS